MRWFFLLFVLIPFIELILLIVVGSQIGAVPLIAILVLTAFLGAFLAKRVGLRVWHSYRIALTEGRIPDEGIMEGLLALLGGVLLIVPGFLTDLAGVMLLLPPTRRFVGRVLRNAMLAKVSQGIKQAIAETQNDFNGLHNFSQARFSIGSIPIDDVFDSRAQVDIVETEGVEVQEVLLLGEGELERGEGD